MAQNDNEELSEGSFMITATIVFLVAVFLSFLSTKVFWPWLFSKPTAYKAYKVVTNVSKMFQKKTVTK